MPKGRLEAFSDGVLAIIITIMVLELRVPHGGDLTALRPLIPVLLSYVLSFVYLGIYWNNHHHMLQATKHVTGLILWANLHLLFWLSLFPFVTGWMGENHFSAVPTAVYGGVLLLAAIAYYLLQGAGPRARQAGRPPAPRGGCGAGGHERRGAGAPPGAPRPAARHDWALGVWPTRDCVRRPTGGRGMGVLER